MERPGRQDDARDRILQGDGASGVGGAEVANSPGLARRTRDVGRAFEMKFLLDEARALEVEAELRRALGASFAIDPFAEPSRGGYAIRSLYCDTRDFAVLRRVGSHRFRKYRVRRYGDGTLAYLERKSRRGMAVSKRRVAIDVAELAWLDRTWLDRTWLRAAEACAPAGWPGASFRAQVERRRLVPACVIGYDRSAFLGVLEGKPVRVTFDRNVRGRLADGWSLAAGRLERPAFDGVVCELKFHAGLPVALKRIVATFGLVARGVSKYRHCMRAWGLLPESRAEGEACDA
ncbi:MAG: polyphosphate polymerase domain-containing protein [Phycisphaerales bacterium]